MEQWEPIKYVSSNKNVQELLKMLYDHGSASYDQIKHLANSHVIQQLDSFGLIEYDQSRAFGLTKETVIKQSNYQLSTKGTNWYRVIISLATLSNDTVIVQLSIGDFKKFVNHLNNFLYSDDPELIKDAYEFLLDDTSGNFYQRSDAKLNHLRDSARRLHTELINVRNDDSLLGAIDKLEKHINEFSSVSNDILDVLLKEGDMIKERLNQLKNLESSQKAFDQKQESLNTIKEKQASLTASNNPLLAQVQGYSHADCLKLVQQYEANQRLQEEHNRLSIRLEELNQEQAFLADKNQELVIKLDSTNQEIADKQNTIEDLKSDEQFQDLKDEEEALTAVYNEENARHLDLIRQYGSIETQLKTKNDEYNDLHHRQSEFQDALTQSKNIVNSIHIDEYSISEELQKINTTEIQINSKTERLTFPDVPKSIYAKDLKQQLNSLTVTEIIDENGITHSLKARMDSLQETIDSADQNATTLLENNEKSLRLILRDQLKSVNKHVSENIDAFVANMNRSNPSHLQFSAKSSISDQGQAILNALEDQNSYNSFFDQLQERIHQQLQNPDITPDDIIDYMLAEIEPRRWYDLAMFYERDNNQEIKPLTTQAINSFSTGERVRCYYIPMFALLEIVQSQMNPDAPRILLMDEAFAPVDNEQTALLLEKIYDLCDLFIATTPGKTLPIVSNSTGSTTLQLQRINLNGRPVVQSFGGPIYEEIT